MRIFIGVGMLNASISVVYLVSLACYTNACIYTITGLLLIIIGLIRIAFCINF